jgi:arylsulfatase
MAHRPNVLWIMTDQHHARCMSWTGHPDVRTPNIDGIAENGVAFTNAFCQSGICTPSRISYKTGLYVHQHGQYHNWGPVRDMESIGSVFRRNGYLTATIGKQHFLPYWKSHGFDYVRPTDIVDTLDDPMDNAYWAHLARHGLERHHEHSMRYHSRDFETYESVLPAEHSVETVTVNEAVKFLTSHDKAQPFFLHLSFNRPHPPYAPPPEYLDSYDPDRITLPESDIDWESKPEWQQNVRTSENGPHPFGKMDEKVLRRSLAYYYDLISLIDDEIGRVLEFLEDTGLADNTIVVYCADHGDHAGEHGIMLKPISTLDSILRVPFIIQWPGRLAQGEQRDQLVETIDLFPTLCDLLEMDMEPVAGESFKDILTDANAPGKKAVFSETWGFRTVRTEKWKYAERGNGEEPELYDVESDPQEGHNLVKDEAMAPVVEDMRRRLDDWEESTQPVILRDMTTMSPFDPDYPRHEGWRILAGEWWPEDERI